MGGTKINKVETGQNSGPLLEKHLKFFYSMVKVFATESPVPRNILYINILNSPNTCSDLCSGVLMFSINLFV